MKISNLPNGGNIRSKLRISFQNGGYTTQMSDIPKLSAITEPLGILPNKQKGGN